MNLGKMSLRNKSFFGKTMENVRNLRDIKLVRSDKRKKWQVSEPIYHSHKKFSGYLMAIEIKKTRVKMVLLFTLKPTIFWTYFQWCWEMLWYI